MSWASRRRTAYLTGIVAFFIIIIGGPAAYWAVTRIPPDCAPGTRRPAGQMSGPCSVLDERLLQPLSTLWARSFPVRPSIYTATAYVENPNPSAGVQLVHYDFGLYDSGGVLIADRTGSAYIMPGGITPILETGIDTGNREVVHTYLKITDQSLVWKRMADPAASIKINDQTASGETSAPQITARATNTSLDTLRNVKFIAVVFDPAGNAFAASGTAVPELAGGASASVTFSWPSPFASSVGRIDIIPLLPPTVEGAAH